MSTRKKLRKCYVVLRKIIYSAPPGRQDQGREGGPPPPLFFPLFPSSRQKGKGRFQEKGTEMVQVRERNRKRPLPPGAPGETGIRQGGRPPPVLETRFR